MKPAAAIRQPSASPRGTAPRSSARDPESRANGAASSRGAPSASSRGAPSASARGAPKRTSGPSTLKSEGDYRLEDQVGHLMRRAHQRHTAIFQDGIPELTPTQFAALVKIRDEGQVSQNQLGRLTAMDPATIQGVIQRLEARKLLARESDPADGRRAILRLTPAGQAAAADAVTRARAITDTTLAPLSAQDRQTFLTLLKKLT